MVRDRCNCYFSFWTMFYSFTPLAAPKNQNFNKMKNHLEVSPLKISVPKIMIICFIVPEI